MKVTLIHGQNHQGSSCNMGRLLAQQVSEEAERTEFFLPRDLNHFCTGCCRCLQNEENCPFYEEKKKILDAMEAADLLIFTTPTYCMNCSAPMKSFIDLTFDLWMVHKPKASMFRKKAVVISAAAGTGTGSAMKTVKTALQYWGVPEIHSYGAAVQATGWDRVKPERKDKITRDLKKLGEKLSSGKAPSVGLRTRFFFGIFSMMQKKGMGSDPSEKAYWEQRGWLGKARPWND